jgi:tetratricopeptide (TPR) repeat protein
MKWGFSFASLMILAGTLLAGPIKPKQVSRLDRIYQAMNDRILTQSDYWFEDGEFPKCIHLLRVHNGLSPSDYEVATNLGWLLESTNQWDEALATYVRYRQMNPNDPDGAFPEANFFFLKKVYAKVPALIEPTLAKKPHANSFRILAHSYERMNMPADSVRVWDKLLAIDPANEAAKVNRAKAAAKLKAPEKRTNDSKN